MPYFALDYATLWNFRVYLFELPYSPVVAANDLLLQLLVLNLMKFRQNGLNLCLIAWNSTNVFKSYTNQTKLRCFVCKSFKNENLNLFCAKLLKMVVFDRSNVPKKWKTKIKCFSGILKSNISNSKNKEFLKLRAGTFASILVRWNWLFWMMQVF